MTTDGEPAYRKQARPRRDEPAEVAAAVADMAVWEHRALCAGVRDWSNLTAAEQIDFCLAPCPVIDQCRAYADRLEGTPGRELARQLPVYGGETGLERYRRRRRTKTQEGRAA